MLGDPDKQICVVAHWHNAKNPTIIICPGIATSMSEPRYFLSILARQCYQLGMNVFQFDYFGDGDSAGDYSLMTLSSTVTSAEKVISYAETLGCDQIGLIGYGIGNIIISFLLKLPTVKTIVLLSPYFSVFSEQRVSIWSHFDNLYPPVADDAVYPQSWHANTPISKLWHAIVGEDVVPSQPCGPIHFSLLQEIRYLNPQLDFQSCYKPVLIVSEQDDDKLLSQSISFEVFEHQLSLYKPSWHWCAECRENISNITTQWVQQHLYPDNTNLNTNPQKSSGHNLLLENLESDFSPQDKPQQHSITLRTDKGAILGILHVPSFKNSKPVCVIYEPGIPGQRVDIHRCGPRLANKLVEQGFYVVRYDAYGTGVSAGEFHDVTWSTRIEDTAAIMNFLENLSGVWLDSFVILGNSAGARVACLAANRKQNVRGCILWGPILIEPTDRVGEGVIKRHPSGMLVTEYCGLWLSIKYNLDERKYNFIKEFEDITAETLVYFAQEEENLINKHRIQDVALKKENISLYEMAGTHGFSTENIQLVIDASAKWLSELYSDQR